MYLSLQVQVIYFIKQAAKFIKKPSKILDLGCGSGYVGIALKKNLFLKSKVFFF